MRNNPVLMVRQALNLSLFAMARKLRTTIYAISVCEHSGHLPESAESRRLLLEAAREAGIKLPANRADKEP